MFQKYSWVLAAVVLAASLPAVVQAQVGQAPLTWPTKEGNVTQAYKDTHHAIDIGGKNGTAIYTSGSGVVERAQCGWNMGYGCLIIINHGRGLKSVYGHLSKLHVEKQDIVTQGQIIGLMGATGKVHVGKKNPALLHFEVIERGTRVDPTEYIQ